MENFPADIEQDLTRPRSGSKWLWLCNIVVPSNPTFSYAQNTEGITYASQDYDPMSMQVGGQKRTGEGDIPEIVLQVSRLNETLYQMVRQTQGCYGGTVELIKVNDKALESSVAALEANFELMQASADSEWITFTLGVPNPLYQQFPLRHFDSGICPYSDPALFKSVKCGYSGGDTSCDGTLEDCISKSNETMWGGEIGMDPSGMGF